MPLVRSHRRRWFRCATSLAAIGLCLPVSRWGNADDAPAKPDEASAKLVAQVEGFPDWVTSVAISADGQRIAAGSFENVRLIAPDGTTLHEWKPGSGFVKSLAFSPDGTSLVIGGYKYLATWTLPATDDDAPTGAEPFVGHRGYVEDVEFSPDGQQLASCGEDGTIRLWDAATHQELAKDAGDGIPVLGVAFSPDGKLIAAAAGDETRLSRKGKVSLLDATDLHLVRELPTHESAATSVCFTHDGRFVLSGSVDERVHVIDPQTGQAHGFFGAHSRPVNGLAMTADDRVAISGSGGRFTGKNEVKFWHPEEGTEWASIEPHGARINDLAVSAGRAGDVSPPILLVTGSNDKTVALIDISGIVTAAGTPSP